MVSKHKTNRYEIQIISYLFDLSYYVVPTLGTFLLVFEFELVVLGTNDSFLASLNSEVRRTNQTAGFAPINNKEQVNHRVCSSQTNFCSILIANDRQIISFSLTCTAFWYEFVCFDERNQLLKTTTKHGSNNEFDNQPLILFFFVFQLIKTMWSDKLKYLNERYQT